MSDAQEVEVTQDFENVIEDITQAYDIYFEDGRMVHVPAHSERIALHIWPNVVTQVFFYSEPQPGFDLSDRIHWMISFPDGSNEGWIMNGQDAIHLINGLSKAVMFAIEAGVSLMPTQIFADEEEGYAPLSQNVSMDPNQLGEEGNDVLPADEQDEGQKEEELPEGWKGLLTSDPSERGGDSPGSG